MASGDLARMATILLGLIMFLFAVMAGVTTDSGDIEGMASAFGLLFHAAAALAALPFLIRSLTVPYVPQRFCIAIIAIAGASAFILGVGALIAENEWSQQNLGLASVCNLVVLVINVFLLRRIRAQMAEYEEFDDVASDYYDAAEDGD